MDKIVNVGGWHRYNWIHDAGTSETAKKDHDGLGEGGHSPGGLCAFACLELALWWLALAKPACLSIYLVGACCNASNIPQSRFAVLSRHRRGLHELEHYSQRGRERPPMAGGLPSWLSMDRS